MTTGTIHCKADSDGRIVVEGLPLRQGQDVELTWKIEDEEAPTPTWAEIQAQRRKMRGSILRDDTDPEEPACDPSGWDANRD